MVGLERKYKLDKVINNLVIDNITKSNNYSLIYDMENIIKEDYEDVYRHIMLKIYDDSNNMSIEFNKKCFTSNVTETVKTFKRLVNLYYNEPEELKKIMIETHSELINDSLSEITLNRNLVMDHGINNYFKMFGFRIKKTKYTSKIIYKLEKYEFDLDENEIRVSYDEMEADVVRHFLSDK